jgi:hypothetical protein
LFVIKIYTVDGMGMRHSVFRKFSSFTFHHQIKNKNYESNYLVFDQGFYQQILELLYVNHHVRGFTSWEQVKGRGSKTVNLTNGIHAWPSLNSALITIVPEEKVQPILDELRALDATSNVMGLRAFVWTIEDGM